MSSTRTPSCAHGEHFEASGCFGRTERRPRPDNSSALRDWPATSSRRQRARRVGDPIVLSFRLLWRFYFHIIFCNAAPDGVGELLGVHSFITEKILGFKGDLNHVDEPPASTPLTLAERQHFVPLRESSQSDIYCPPPSPPSALCRSKSHFSAAVRRASRALRPPRTPSG